jgi:hypothetical protein
VNYISGTYGIDHDAIGTFLVDQLNQLDDYEIDLVLSPVFTPKLSDQAVFAEQLGGNSVPRDEFPSLIEQIVTRPTYAHLITPDGTAHRVKLSGVPIERYIHRLRLEGSIPEAILNLLDSVSASNTADRPMLKAVARRLAWSTPGAQEILARYLTNAPQRGGYALADVTDLLDFMESRKPVDLADLLARMPGWQKALRDQIDVGSGGQPFFHDDIRFMHGGARDQRAEGDSRMSGKERELAFLVRLEKILE